MQNFLALVIRYGVHLLFVVLEVICFFLIIRNNDEQRAIWNHSINSFTTLINRRADKIFQYSKLEEVNDSLLSENAQLLQRIIASDQIKLENIDSSDHQYQLIPASICNASVHLRNNFLTLCEGTEKGIAKDMGVVSSKGIVGIVVQVNDSYSLVMSVLNARTRISASIKRLGSFGSLVWNGYSSQRMNLLSIPKHIEIQLGDTIVTSGFSTIFPKNIDIGVISDIQAERGTGNHYIEVSLFNDLARTESVYVIDNQQKGLQRSIEQYEN
jgi:rod shape-determining protein MreC